LNARVKIDAVPGSKFESGKKSNSPSKMSDTTTHMTDFMEQVLKEEYERYEVDVRVREFFKQFCYSDTLDDEKPVWVYDKIKDWINNTLSVMGEFDSLPPMMQHAIYRDIDQDYIADWLTDKHTNWWDERHEGEDEEEEFRQERARLRAEAEGDILASLEGELDETDIMLLAHPEMTENPDAYYDITTYGAVAGAGDDPC